MAAAVTDGVLVVDKPAGFTSFDVVAKMRGMLKTKKIGHAGTLDPMATGILPLLIGRAAKAMDILPDSRKRYTAAFRLGVTTDTQDITGEVLSRRAVNVTETQVLAAVNSFHGLIMQTPPMYSAVKIGGKRLYDLARQGVEIEREARPVTIGEIEVLSHTEEEYIINALCSKGTYIRTLCHDIGQKLGCGAAMTALRRTMAAGFTLEEAVTLEEAQRLTDMGELASRILPVETIFTALPQIRLNEKRARLFINGVPIALSGEGGCFAVYGPQGFLGVARAGEDGAVADRKLFCPAE